MRRTTTLPLDILGALGTVLAADLAMALSIPGVRVGLGIPFVLWAPGFALTSALFPRVEPPSRGLAPSPRRLLSPLERFALSIGLSLTLVPLAGLILRLTPWGLEVGPAMVTLNALTLGLIVVAWWRRSRLPEEVRPQFAVPWPQGPAERGVRALQILVLVAVLAAVGALAYALLVPAKDEPFTEFYVLGPGGKSVDYPDQLAPGERATLVVGVVPHEHREVSDTVTITLSSGTVVETDGNRTFEVASTQVLLSRAVRLGDLEKSEFPVPFDAPTQPGTYRIDLVLRQEPDPQAYRSLHLWFTVGG